MSKTTKTTTATTPKTKSKQSTETTAKSKIANATTATKTTTTKVPTKTSKNNEDRIKTKTLTNATTAAKTTTTNDNKRSGVGVATTTTTTKVPTKKAAIKTVKNNDDQTKSKTLTKSSSIEATKTNTTPKAAANTTRTRTQTTTKPIAKTTTSTATTLQKSSAKTTNAAAKPSDRTQPVRAKHSAAIVEQVRNNAVNLNANKSPAKPNAVLDSYHNVTVASPPTKRKELPSHKEEGKKVIKVAEEVEKNDNVTRPRTRTLDDEEVVVLKSASSKLRSEQEIQQTGAELLQQPKEPVAFEVNFADKRERSRSRARETVQETEASEYSDDFESYESDFEASSATTQNDTTTDTESSDGSGSDTDSNLNASSADTEDAESAIGHDDKSAQLDTDEESELTQFPITVIQRDKERERKLDSGNYEMNSRQHPKLTELTQQQQTIFDSMDTTIASEQLDSGISSYENGNTTIPMGAGSTNNAAVYGGYAEFNTHPVRTQRGLELMSKIQFDTISYTLLDFKPISYDVFMQTFGKLNTTQSSTQTNDQHISMECQTEDCDVRSIWTQHPPQYDLQTVQRLGGGGINTVQNCCGELPQSELSTGTSKPADEFEASLQALSAFRERECTRTVTQQLRRLRKPIDFERLNAFLLNSSLLMSRVLNASDSGKHSQYQSTNTSSQLAVVSTGHRQLGTNILNALHVVRVFANAKFNLVITVHESLPEADVYRSDFSNLLMVWSTSDNVKPIRLLSTWSEVCRAEICNDSSDIIVCGLRDGSVAMWDLRETYSFCSKLDGHLTHFAATQSIVPLWNGANNGGNDSERKLLDMGAVVDIKSFRALPRNVGIAGIANGYKSIQFTSLNDTGILTVWTLVETAGNKMENFYSHAVNLKRSPNTTSKFEYSSPWARIKLIQSAICDLRNYLEQGILKSQSKFELTQSNFQKNIYNDEVLRELNETHTELKQGHQTLQGLRFTSIDTGCERIYICTNRNFILICSKSLKSERFRKISINESRFLFPTAIRALSNENFLAVGLSNGSVIILNCEQNHTALLSAAEAAAVEHALNENQSVVNPPSTDYDLETGKSCAIQNIILNERRLFTGENTTDFNQNFDDIRPSTAAACIAMINEDKKPFELRVYDQQMLLSGSVLRKHLVQSLELSSDGWKLFALSDGEVRTYDFFLDREVTDNMGVSESQKLIDMTVARGAANEQFLVALCAKGEVQVHLLKQ